MEKQIKELVALLGITELQAYYHIQARAELLRRRQIKVRTAHDQGR